MIDSETDSSLSDEGVMVAELMFATPRDSSKSTFVGKTPVLAISKIWKLVSRFRGLENRVEDLV